MNQGIQQMGAGSFAQPVSMPKGKPVQAMNDIMALARKMSDAQLADVLAGKSMDIPQFAAMTEAMGRKKLRTAMQGQQAAQQAQQPTVRDKLLAENMQAGGIDQLPAPNMGSVDMASGGIVAFSGEDNDQVIEEDQKESGRNWFERLRDSLYSPSEKYLSDVMRGKKATPPEGNRITAKDIELMRAGKQPGAPMPMTDEQKAEFQREANRGIRAPLANAVPSVPDTATPTPAPAAATTRAPSTGVGAAVGMPSYEDLMKRRTTDYLSKLEGLSDKQRESLTQLKKEGMGEGLMQLAAGILSSPTLSRGLAKGLPMLASSAAATRKEARAVENLANEYDMNLAKAREAAEKGDMALALQYQQVANQNKYQMGMLDVYGQRNAIMGESNMLPKVQLGLANADKQALAEAKAKFPMVTKSNQAAFDAFVRKRAYELKIENPLTKPYASLGGSDFGGTSGFNVVQSLPKGAKVIDPFAEG